MPRAVELAQVQDEVVVAARAVDERGKPKDAPRGLSQKAVQQTRVGERQRWPHCVIWQGPFLRRRNRLCAKLRLVLGDHPRIALDTTRHVERVAAERGFAHVDQAGLVQWLTVAARVT